MSDEGLLDLAEAAGVATRWKDVNENWAEVSFDTVRHVLDALGLHTGSPAQVAESLAEVRVKSNRLPPLITAELGQPISLPLPVGPCQVTLEDGTMLDAVLVEGPGVSGAQLSGLGMAGYHRLEAGGQETTLAVAPPRALGVDDVAPGRRPWGMAAQLYSLRRDGDAGLGDFGALRHLVQSAAARGADAVAISPVHAQFSADPDRFSPYSPSSRIMLNVLHAELPLTGPEAEALAMESLVDWPKAGRLRLAMMRRMFAEADATTLGAFAAWRAEQGSRLETHARFEALHAHFFGGQGLWHWRSWPAAFSHPDNPEVAEFAAQHQDQVSLHAFMQFLADTGLSAAQRAAREAGMAIGLITDLAVGADSGGSYCWSHQEETLQHLSIGAPPDLLAPQGQGWGLAAFSPRGLIKKGYAAYLAMLRAAMRHAGGVRIDHVMGLQRLWVIPDGQPSSAGTYLRYPLEELLRLVALESHRHRCIVLGEDLGTVPDGFTGQLDRSGVLGLRVLWFERFKTGEHEFIPPAQWTPHATAMTSTHDLATVAGWWQGRDLDCRKPLGLLGDERGIAYHYETRDWERGLLWRALHQSGATAAVRPAAHDTWPVVEATFRHVGGSACSLAIFPLEDVLALSDQPNLPGTMDEHPNWRRRLPGTAATLFDDPKVAERLAALNEARANSAIPNDTGTATV